VTFAISRPDFKDGIPENDMCRTKSLRRPAPKLAPFTVAPVDSKERPTIVQRARRSAALSVALFLSAHIHAATIDTATAPGAPPVVTRAPTGAVHLAQAPSEKSSIPEKILPKLDAPIVRALKRSRGELPNDKAMVLDPDIPVRDGDRVLVDIDATVSDALLKGIALAGGQLAPSPDAARVVRVMIPLSQVEALAGRADVNFVSPATLSHESTLYVAPAAPAGAAAGKP